MSSLLYKGQHVACCCSNCLNALGEIRGEIKCSRDGAFHHNLYECEHYEFSWRRFEERDSFISAEPYTCPRCQNENHPPDAKFCRICGLRIGGQP